MSAGTLFVSNLPASASSERLEELFSEVGPVKRCFVVRDKDSEKCRGIGYVTYAMGEDAERALKEITKYDGHKIFVVLAKKKLSDEKKRKEKKDLQETESPKEVPEKKSHQKAKGMKKKKMKAKLIIRNLSFKCSEAELKEAFSKFGTVLDVNIPLKPDGKKRGFAFVQFKNMFEAGKAVAVMNLKEIKDRQIAVDWAVAKDMFVTTQLGVASVSEKDQNESSEEAGVGENSDMEDEPPAKKSKAQQEEDEQSGSPSEDDEDENEDHKESEGEENGSESQEADSDDSCPASDDDDDDDDDDDIIDDDSDDDDDEENAQQKKKKAKNPLPSDVNEGRTVFIRNLSFNSEEEGIEEILLQFGELNYVRVVLHPETGHSKGCAFAQFKSKEAAERCLAAAQNDSETGGVRVDGRKLNIVLAVSRDDAAKLKTKKVKTHKGSRNLYLAREGLIRAGTKAAEGVSDSDMAKRARFEDLKRAKLKNVNIFVSRTRLCIHNLPKSMDRKRLLHLCLSAAGGGKRVQITECHVMYDRKPVRGQVMGKPLGFGFVEFKEHEHALQALRHLNNNPKIFSANKRPIVEFSLEDTRKLKLKAMRLQQSKIKLTSDSGAEKNQSLKAGKQEEGSKQPQLKSPGKGKAAAQQTGGPKTNMEYTKGVQSAHYSGFRTTPEVEHVELQDGKKRQKVLPMPSHRGPKIRQRDKGKQPVQSKKVKKGPSRKDRKVFSLAKPNQNKKQNAKPVKKKFQNKDHFENLVEQYKKKLMGASSSKGSLVKKSKWFS
ncbi:hypothetical protein AOLI_G00095520 [Acnodon oligacanthus]